MRLPTSFESELEARRKAVQDARQRIVLLEAELRGFEAAASLLARSTPSVEPADHNGLDGRAGIRGNWRAILAATAPRYPDPVTLDDFQEIAEELGTPTLRPTLRSQMSIYSTAGYLERIGQGAYRLTDKGAEMLGVTITRQSAGPKPDNNTDEPTSGLGENDHHNEAKEGEMHAARASPFT